MSSAGEREWRLGAGGWLRRLCLLLLLLLLAMSSLAPAFLSGVPLRLQVVQRFLAPGGDHEVVVSKRLAWGPNELFDPAIVVSVELRRCDTGACVASERLDLVEDSDLEEAHVALEQSAVVVRGLDERAPRTLRFDRPR